MAIFQVSVDRLHQFVFIRKAYVSVLPKEPGGESFADCLYEFAVAGKIEKGFVGPKGIIAHEVPRTARRAKLRIWPSNVPGEMPIDWVLDIGQRLTIDTFAGVRWRLENLGFDCGGDATEGPATRRAARAFMEWMGLMSAEDEVAQKGAVVMEIDLTKEFRKALDQEFDRPAGLHHGGVFKGDDQLDWQVP